MPAVPTKKLLELLADGQPPELRLATVQVLKGLELKEAEIGEAVVPLLADDSPALRLAAVQLLGQMKHKPALKPLAALIEHGGEVGEAAAQAVAQLGDRGVSTLHELMPKVAPGLRRYIGAALAGLTRSPEERLGILQDKDPGVVDSAVQSLLQQLPDLGKADRQKLLDQLLKLAGQTKPPLSAATELALVRLFTALDDPKAAKAIWPWVKAGHSFEVRSHALQTLGAWVSTATPEQWSLLFQTAQDGDFRIASLALVLLKKLPAAKEAQGHWLKLLAAPDVSVRRLAVEKLGDGEAKPVAEALAEQLGHPDEALRNAVLARLVTWSSGRKLLTERLLAEESVDKAWTLARALAKHLGRFDGKWRAEVFKHAAAHLEKEDRRADPLLFLLREIDGKELRDRLEEKAIAWRKKKNYPQALHYLRHLARDPALGFALRFELAACGLKVSTQDLEARQNDPCLHQFALLCQQDEAALLKAIDQNKWLEPADLYYLGFHFAEGERLYWNFAKELLQRVVKRSPQSKTAQAAKAKLKRAGLA